MRLPYCLKIQDTYLFPEEILDHAKILIILEELRLPYESNFVKRGDLLKFPWDDEDTDENVPGHMAPGTWFDIYSFKAKSQYRS